VRMWRRERVERRRVEGVARGPVRTQRREETKGRRVTATERVWVCVRERKKEREREREREGEGEGEGERPHVRANKFPKLSDRLPLSPLPWMSNFTLQKGQRKHDTSAHAYDKCGAIMIGPARPALTLSLRSTSLPTSGVVLPARPNGPRGAVGGDV
jgi:hypothetical protein